MSAKERDSLSAAAKLNCMSVQKFCMRVIFGQKGAV